MPTQTVVAQAPPHGGSWAWNVATSASSAASLGTFFFAGRSTQLMTALASTSGCHVPSGFRRRYWSASCSNAAPEPPCTAWARESARIGQPRERS